MSQSHLDSTVHPHQAIHVYELRLRLTDLGLLGQSVVLLLLFRCMVCKGHIELGGVIAGMKMKTQSELESEQQVGEHGTYHTR